MSTPNDGGSAFPETFSTFDLDERKLKDVYSAGGMTLRDYFAAKAMAAIVSSLGDPQHRQAMLDEGKSLLDVPRVAYEIADNMLKTRL